MTRARAGLALLVPLALLAGSGAACDRRRPLASCEDDLRGVYDADGGSWMILDEPTGLQAYPLFPDVPQVPGLEVAPRMIALRRTPGGITGHVRRRYMRGSRQCVAEVSARITACAGEAIELVLADPAPPLEWPAEPERPCEWPRLDSSRRERWVRR